MTKLPQVVAEIRNGVMKQIAAPLKPENSNFVICCKYGDWSGFRTLADCQRQYQELERYYRESNGSRYFYVEER